MADRHLQCLLAFLPALRNQCFYRCVAKCLNLLEDDVIEAMNEWLWNIDNSPIYLIESHKCSLMELNLISVI